MSGLPIAQYPEIVPPMVQVTTTFVGASATDVEASVATPLEQKINGVENIDLHEVDQRQRRHADAEGVSFDVGLEPRHGQRADAEQLSEAMPQLPQSVKNYGVAVKKALAFPLLVISLKSPNGTYDNNFLSNYATININDNIARIQGVGQINLFGGSDYAMRIWLRPDRIAPARHHGARHRERHLAAEPAVARPARSAARRPSPGTEFTYTVRTQGRLLNEEEFGEHHRPHEPRRLAGAAEGRRAPRARHAALQRRRPARRQARGGHRGLPDPGHERPRRWPSDIKTDAGGPHDAVPARHGVHGLARHDAAGRGGHHRDRAHAVRGGRRSSSSWCSSSCRTGAPR